MSSRALVIVVLLLLAERRHARAEAGVGDEHDPPPSPLRLGILAGALVVHYVTDYVIEDRLAPESCRWCSPPGFDTRIRNAVVWDDRKRAARISDAGAYLISPMISIGLLAVSSREARCPGRRWLRDVVPIAESALYTQLVTQAFKYSVGRQRPVVHFGGTTERSTEDNLSFYSGHTTLAFSLAVSSSLIAYRRRYRFAPAIMISTLALGVTTAYLRMAADRHYFSDVLVGTFAGTAGGYLVPQLGSSVGKRAQIVPTSNGIAIAGGF